ncbi:MAG: hypothetical protein QOD55_2673, partial [Solirubrobacteraceae bacterium]|nr:hypothetical protein [Solirubrobacteraceae bacterium]
AKALVTSRTLAPARASAAHSAWS